MQTLRVTPAMEAGLSDHVWSVEELVALLEPIEIRAEWLKHDGTDSSRLQTGRRPKGD